MHKIPVNILIYRIKAKGVFDGIHTFNFVSMIHLMDLLLGIINEPNLALQRKDEDIANVVSFLDEGNMPERQ
jgi:hypothetical protein